MGLSCNGSFRHGGGGVCDPMVRCMCVEEKQLKVNAVASG